MPTAGNSGSARLHEHRDEVNGQHESAIAGRLQLCSGGDAPTGALPCNTASHTPHSADARADLAPSSSLHSSRRFIASSRCSFGQDVDKRGMMGTCLPALQLCFCCWPDLARTSIVHATMFSRHVCISQLSAGSNKARSVASSQAWLSCRQARTHAYAGAACMQVLQLCSCLSPMLPITARTSALRTGG